MPSLVKGDPHRQSPNGKVLSEIIERHNMIITNSLRDRTEGLMTRRRKPKAKSVIDFVILRNDLNKDFEGLVIDEEMKHVLSRIVKRRGKIEKIMESDHYILIGKFNFIWSPEEKVDHIEIFNLKNAKYIDNFKKLTSEPTILSSIFEKEPDLDKATIKFFDKLFKCIHQCFKKIQVKGKVHEDLECMISKKKILKHKDDTRNS